MTLTPLVDGQVWVRAYPVRYLGCVFEARMTVLALGDGRLALHSPCPIDDDLAAEIRALGRVECLIAPGTYHWLHIDSARAAFPDAEVFVCPGVERKVPGVGPDRLLSAHAPEQWAAVMDQLFVKGSRFMSEVVFLHRPSRTLVLTDLLENVTDQTPGTNLALRFWLGAVFRMWNRPRPAPEYQLGWRRAAGGALRTILGWDFDRVVVAHGDLILQDAKRVLTRAWADRLRA